MSFQITFDPSTLTPEQREHLAGFIMSYPSAKPAATLGTALSKEIGAFPIRKHDDQPDANDFEAQIKARIVDGTIDPNHQQSRRQQYADVIDAKLRADEALTQLVADGNQTDAEIAFGDPSAAAAFAPLPLGVMPAPYTVAASQPSIAQEAQSSGENPTAAFTLPAPPSVNAAAIAAPADTSRAEVDKNGLPWDSRIHASTKRKNADGTWTNKRGVDESFRIQIEAELRQAMGAPAADTCSAWPFTPPAPPAPPAPLSDPKAAFVSLVGRTAAALQAGKVTQKEVIDICAANGLAALPLLANRLDLVAQVAGQIDMLIASR